MTRILVVEDDPKMSRLLAGDLELEGYKVDVANDGATGLEKAQALKPDLILLDVMLPTMSGYDVCRALRRDGVDTPILFLTAKGQESDKVVGLGLGADDYVTKPFSGLELMARVKALLRRHKRELDKVAVLEFDDVRVDFRRMEATKASKSGTKSLALTPKEFQLLELLARHRGEVVSRRRCLEEIWGYDEMPTTRTVDNQVLTLRQKLYGKGREGAIVTVHGVGYKFIGSTA
jgi:DNA-binding response OmpR family regulator